MTVPIDRDYANELAKCSTQIAKWVEKRNGLIRALAKQGHSLRTIADAAGISHTAVAKILAR
jgi:lambda repressor-like predicted transcriptional regulator